MITEQDNAHRTGMSTKENAVNIAPQLQDSSHSRVVQDKTVARGQYCGHSEYSEYRRVVTGQCS